MIATPFTVAIIHPMSVLQVSPRFSYVYFPNWEPEFHLDIVRLIEWPGVRGGDE
jgi:hypothetical protein